MRCIIILLFLLNFLCYNLHGQISQLADSADLRFIEVLNSIEKESFIEKYDSAIYYFYNTANEIALAESIAYDSAEEDTSEKEEVFVYRTPNLPDLTRYYDGFSAAIKSSVRLSKSEKKANNNRLYFRIVADLSKTEELVCLSVIRNRNKKRLDKELEKIKAVKLFPMRARGGGEQKLEAVFYVEFD